MRKMFKVVWVAAVLITGFALWIASAHAGQVKRYSFGPVTADSNEVITVTGFPIEGATHVVVILSNGGTATTQADSIASFTTRVYPDSSGFPVSSVYPAAALDADSTTQWTATGTIVNTSWRRSTGGRTLMFVPGLLAAQPLNKHFAAKQMEFQIINVLRRASGSTPSAATTGPIRVDVAVYYDYWP